VSRALVLALLVVAPPVAGCAREERDLRPAPETNGPPRVPATASPYDGNAWATNEGEKLYARFNCVGCHAHGGGGMGPPLMDAAWRYGSEPADVFASIADGRPDGMPSFRARLSEEQTWKLVAYVRSMSGLTPWLSRPSRNDEMQVKDAEYRTERQTPVKEAK
jgi:cytochrome c oxidase cbb3-type subunit 3